MTFEELEVGQDFYIGGVRVGYKVNDKFYYSYIHNNQHSWTIFYIFYHLDAKKPLIITTEPPQFLLPEVEAEIEHAIQN